MGKKGQESESTFTAAEQATKWRNPTVQAECGATGFLGTINSCLTKQALKHAKSKLDRESKNISTTLTFSCCIKMERKINDYWFLVWGHPNRN